VAYVAELAGLVEVLGDMLSSPITVVAIVLTLALGIWLPRSWILPAIVAFVADVVAVLLLYKSWEAQGIGVAEQSLQGFGLFCIITYCTYVVVQIIKMVLNKVEASSRQASNDKEDQDSEQ
jgi:hypothetical protein